MGRKSIVFRHDHSKGRPSKILTEKVESVPRTNPPEVSKLAERI